MKYSRITNTTITSGSQYYGKSPVIEWRFFVILYRWESDPKDLCNTNQYNRYPKCLNAIFFIYDQYITNSTRSLVFIKFKLLIIFFKIQDPVIAEFVRKVTKKRTPKSIFKRVFNRSCYS